MIFRLKRAKDHTAEAERMSEIGLNIYTLSKLALQMSDNFHNLAHLPR
jgi:hypothetical protein